VKPTNDNKNRLLIKEPSKKRAKDDQSKTKCLNYNQLGHLTKDWLKLLRINENLTQSK
jgi:hypothetical protein